MQAEWTGGFGGIHLRLRAREDGILQVTRDLSGQFRENEYSPVTECPEGAWIRRTEAGSEVFALPGLCVRVNRGTGALSFADGSGNLLLRECPDCPAELQEAEIRRSVFSEEPRITEKTGADGARWKMRRSLTAASQASGGFSMRCSASPRTAIRRSLGSAG